MDYAKHYALLVNRARERVLEGYCERHHVVPRCMGGGDKPENIVRLTAEEHFVAHQLLVKMYPGHLGLTAALVSMCGRGRNLRRSNKFYGWFRRRHAEAVSARLKGVPKTVEHRAALSRAKMGKKRGPHSAQHRARQSASIKLAMANVDKSHMKTPEYRTKQADNMRRVWAARHAAMEA